MKFIELPVDGYETVVYCEDIAGDLKAFISVHDTTLGPALGGVRMSAYRSEQQAFTDVNRLAKGMTYKSALAGLALGGGKAVIIGNPQRDKSPPLFQAMGRFIDSFEGLYIGAEDLGTTVDDLNLMRDVTPFVTGLSRARISSGDPSPFTALGVFLGMHASLERRLGTNDFSGVRVAVQGCGNVASQLCQRLHDAGAVLTVADLRAERAQWLGECYDARVVSAEAIYDVECEIFAPCALGGVLNDETLPRLRCQIVAGCANNQCLSETDGDHLQARNILYAPDFAINAGGVINIAAELEAEGYDRARALSNVWGIYDTVQDVFDLAEAQNLTTNRAAIVLAERQLEVGRRHKASVSVNGW
ncbi:MAG: leucine dehydrogenase [bacterium]|nr:leucine dehydrogenase [bacterium]